MENEKQGHSEYILKRKTSSKGYSQQWDTDWNNEMIKSSSYGSCSRCDQNENYEISKNFANTWERLNKNVLIIDNEMPQQ